MGKIVVSEFITLDGVMQDPGGMGEIEKGGWAFKVNRGPEGDKFKLDELMGSDALLLGRVTYEGFARAWPAMTDSAGFAAKMNSMPKHVVSATLAKPEWNNSHVIRSNVAGEIASLKQTYAKDILVNGSGVLFQTLMEHGLVDEIRLLVYPFVLGMGKRLFTDGMHANLKLTCAEQHPSGLMLLIYQPA